MARRHAEMSLLRFTNDHEWIRVNDDGTAVVGITQYAERRLGRLEFIELPEVGQTLEIGDDAAIFESDTASSEVKAPACGTVTRINTCIIDTPAKVNEDPTGRGWFFKLALSDLTELDDLMDEQAYLSLIESLD